jgi:hypothetical protein
VQFNHRWLLVTSVQKKTCESFSISRTSRRCAGQAGAKKVLKIPNGQKTLTGNIIDEKETEWFCLKLLYQSF